MDEVTKTVIYTALNITLQAILPLLAVAASGWLVSKARLYWAQFKEAQPNVANTLGWAASVAVSAAEQAGAAQLIQDKKAYALQVAQALLKARGIGIDLIALDGAIEAAVYDRFNNPKAKMLPTLK
jgi:hypothetical protein